MIEATRLFRVTTHTQYVVNTKRLSLDMNRNNSSYSDDSIHVPRASENSEVDPSIPRLFHEVSGNSPEAFPETSS